ncbi:hypothetical protein BDR26DRAFT_932939 [Obelidium mucronatum]|nr:hypothetical protein BDR26DRAFT_932939 [Obelidium mucronatum]
MDMATPPYEVDATTKNVCDYYKQALSHTWHQETTIPRGVKLNPQATKSIKAVLTHPNADCATQVAYFADELALPSLVQQCLAHYAKHYVQTENTLLFTMLCLDLNHPEFLEEAYKEADDIKWLMKVIQAGRSTLADADVADVERVVKDLPIFPWKEARKVSTWIMARQDALPLMHHIDWSHTEGIGAYSILRSQVLPYLAVTSPEYQAWFKLHHESVILLALVRLMG